MKLRKFNRDNCSNISSHRPSLRVNKNTFSFNQAACEKLNLKDKDRINLFQDEEEPKDWYFEKTNEESGLSLRKGDKTGLRCSGSNIARLMLESVVKDSCKSKQFMIATVPTDGMFAIITSAAK